MRATRVLILVVIVLSLADLVSTALLLRLDVVEELNPIGAWLFERTGVTGVSLGKLASVAFATRILWTYSGDEDRECRRYALYGTLVSVMVLLVLSSLHVISWVSVFEV